MKATTQFDILSLFPTFFVSPLSQSILGRSIRKGIIDVDVHNLRDFAPEPKKTVDDKPYGGGAGMVLRVDVLVNALKNISKRGEKPYVVLLDPKGKIYNQELAERFAKKRRILLVCGHYEGVDERFAKNCVDEAISVGDYILSGGEPAALIIIDSVSRLKPAALGNKASYEAESFSKVKINEGKYVRILDFPAYTRPKIFMGKKVPKVLLEGNHEKINTWRRKKALECTKKLRPSFFTVP